MFLSFPGGSAGKESACNAEDPGLTPGSGRSPGEGIGYPLQSSLASLVYSAGKESTFNVGGLGSIPRLGRSPGEGKGYPLQYSGLEHSMDCVVHGGLENLMDCMVHGVAKSQTRLSIFHILSPS